MAAKVAKQASLPTTFAAAEEKSQRIKAQQLPMYNAPPQDSRYIDEKPGRLQMGISSVRKAMSYYLKGCKDAYLFVKNGITSSVQFGKDAYVYLRNPPPEFLPKVGVITVSGLTGMVLARKGTKFKKIAYPVGLGILGFSVCYPAQSVIVAKVTAGKVYAASHRVYTVIGPLGTKKSSTEVPVAQDKDIQEASRASHSLLNAHKTSLKSEDKAETSQEQIQRRRSDAHKEYETLTGNMKVENVRSGVMKASRFKPDSNLLDHGQANPEDADMYSNRS